MIWLLSFLQGKIMQMKRVIDEKLGSISNNRSNQDSGIVIRSRSDIARNEMRNAENGKITIHRVNRRVSSASSEVEADVQNRNLGRGITVNKQRMPVRCSICATRGKIIENPGGSPKWKCNACDSTFS